MTWIALWIVGFAITYLDLESQLLRQAQAGNRESQELWPHRAHLLWFVVPLWPAFLALRLLSLLLDGGRNP